MALDRDAAREVLQRWNPAQHGTDKILDALEGCVRPDPPHTVDRETLASAVQAQRYGGRMFGAENPQDYAVADRILALLRPVDGVTLTRNDVQGAIESYDDGAWSQREGNVLRFDGSIDLDAVLALLRR